MRESECIINWWTDSAALVALRRGSSPSWNLNLIIRRIREEFPRLTIRPHWVPGAQNPADGISRGRDFSWSAEDASAISQIIDKEGEITKSDYNKLMELAHGSETLSNILQH